MAPKAVDASCCILGPPAFIESAKTSVCKRVLGEDRLKFYSQLQAILAKKKRYCKTRNFRKRLIFVNFVNWTNVLELVFAKGFFIHILIDGRRQITKISVYESGKIVIYEKKSAGSSIFVGAERVENLIRSDPDKSEFTKSGRF